MASIKKLGKRIVGHPEETIPVVTPHDWFKKNTPLHTPRSFLKNYVISLFPIFQWIRRYNLGWLAGDVIAGLTVGLVVVPQGMSYAIIATLPAQYGLYSSFVGVLFYCLFATSKDVSIGPVAVMSLTVSTIIADVVKAHGKEFSAPEIATGLAFICGFIVLGIGLLRLGWLVEFIPAPAVSGFMTGSAINIAAGQVPGLMGITGFNTRAATYLVIIDTLKGLPRTTKDAAFGLVGLFALYVIYYSCNYLTKRYPRRARIFFFVSVFRNAFVIVILTLAAFLYTRHRKSKSGKYPIKILQTVPPGFQDVHQPTINKKLLSALAPHLPVATIILLLEHIAIGKSFGRVNGYTINPNQELIAIGVTNTVGSCFGAYPATGSFSRTAIKAKSGVRTPLAGVFTAIVVLVALYGCTPAFYWIPTAGLSAVIIHAVVPLCASPAQIYSFWRVSPLECIIFWAAVLVTVFSTIENGIYTAIISSIVLLLIRVAHPRSNFLGRVTVKGNNGRDSKEVYVPLTNNGIVNPDIVPQLPTPGIVIYRFEESFLYPNVHYANTALVDYVKKNTRRGKDMSNVKASDRPWNDPGPSAAGAVSDHAANEQLPSLHAIVLDFSAISQIDTTGVQSLIDTRNEVERWTDHPVEFHFATILSPWIHRALVAGGFGTGEVLGHADHDVANVVPVNDGIPTSPIDEESRVDEKNIKRESSFDSHDDHLLRGDTPFFHIGVDAAVKSAERGLGKRYPESTF